MSETSHEAMLPRVFRVTETRRESADVMTLTFAPADGRPSYTFRPAQIGMVGLPGIGEVPISFSSAASDRAKVGMTIRRAGAVTAALVDLVPGDLVTMRGPYGTSWPIAAAAGRHVLFIAGGLGLAPLRSAVVAALAAPDDFRSLTLLYGARTPADHLFAADLAEWRQTCQVHLIVDEPSPIWSGPVGLVTELVADCMVSPGETTVMMCGPDVMMKAVGHDLIDNHVEAGSIWLTMERNMKCGIGLCGHCQFGRYFLCKDGPVLSWAQVGGLYEIPEL